MHITSRYYQTLRLWLEEPRLHGGSLYLPGLPVQYDVRKLEAIFQLRKVRGTDWGASNQSYHMFILIGCKFLAILFTGVEFGGERGEGRRGEGEEERGGG